MIWWCGLDIKVDIKQIWYDGVGWIHLARDRNWRNLL
jgi:hypothetical protein